MGALDLAASNELLDHALLVGSYTPVGPLKLRLMTANGTSSSAGTEVTGGSYAPQTITFGTASGGQASNATEIVFTGLPAATVVGLEIWDSAGTPVRQWWGPLAASRSIASGGELKFPAGSITVAFPST
ncbi:hypothetical protein ACFVH6_21830 [Spirillospora sp. NPDC127200]